MVKLYEPPISRASDAVASAEIKPDNHGHRAGHDSASAKGRPLGRLVFNATNEIYIESQQGAKRSVFPRLGMTDAGLLSIEARDFTLLTADVHLYLEADRQGYSAINFNQHIETNR